MGFRNARSGVLAVIEASMPSFIRRLKGSNSRLLQRHDSWLTIEFQS